MSRVAVFGAGYVGLVTGACLAELGHDVAVRDVLADRIDALRRGDVPIYEPRLGELLARNAERLRFTTEVGEAIDRAEFVFVAVGTPPTYSGDADLSAVWTVIDELPKLERRVIVVVKSTVPVGTGAKVRARLDDRGFRDVGYVSNPEFTAEGTAIRDFLEPDRIVIGAFDDVDGDAVAELHRGIDAPVIRSDVASAEMIKLAANAALMTRISFINEIANVCEATGADVVKVAEGIGLDRRIGSSFLKAGVGYGGSCLLGDETVLVRSRGRTRVINLERLYDETEAGDELEILTWRPDGDGPEFGPVAFLTRREYEGDIVEVRTTMGRRVRCTPDHLFVTQDGLKLAEDLTGADWLPIAQGSPPLSRRRPIRLNTGDAIEEEGLAPRQVIVRPHHDEIAALGARGLRTAIAVAERPRGGVARSHDIVRSGALRLHEAAELDLELGDAFPGTVTNGTFLPSIEADEAFWRIVGLYIAEGHSSTDGLRRRLQWSFHPTDEGELAAEVASYWRSLGVHVDVRKQPTTTCVVISSRVLVGWWLRELGLGANCYEQRLPDLIWDAPLEHKRAVLAGAWLGDGSWSFINRRPSVVLEYGTVSRELADGLLRLLGDLGIVARLEVGRTAKSTVDTYRLCIAPTGYRRRDNAAWVRVADVKRDSHAGYVYSLEVPPTHTFVTTGGLTLSNCFPKDSLALKQLAANSGYHFQLLNAVIEVNELQKRRVIGKLNRHLGSLRGKTIALLGLAFKPDTDDTREAPSLVLAGRLLAEGAEVRAWDPVAHPDGLHGVVQSPSIEEALAGVDAAVLVTEWPQLHEVDWAAAARGMRRPVLVDGRNMLDPEALRAAGFTYEGIGRGVPGGDSL